MEDLASSNDRMTFEIGKCQQRILKWVLRTLNQHYPGLRHTTCETQYIHVPEAIL